ncbi:MAG: cysteine desulfurase [candidate division Zixibacteria bacterium SM23_81]|nr:MAG: cysteine desulfurase [candidate division Zixibacteria bacterium SM23_81]
MRTVYLDHSATTPVHPDVVEAMLPFFTEEYGNASSIHRFGRNARVAVDEAREKVARLLNAQDQEIYFTSGGTEGDNLAIKGVAWALRDKGDHIITSQIEHEAVLNTCRYLERNGFEVNYLPVDQYGMVDPTDVRKAITDKTILISVMHANNEVGTIQPIAEIGAMARQREILFHTDAVQTVGKLPVDVKALSVDLLSMSGHKFYGPKGVGALYMRKGAKIQPLAHGGHHENWKRAGTENIPGIVGMAKAMEICYQELDIVSKKESQLRDALQKGIQETIADVRFNGHPTQRLPGSLSACFQALEGEALILSLDLKGVAASTGSACSSGSLEPSHVLKAMGVPIEIAHGSARLTLGRSNTQEEIDYVLEVLPQIVDRLRSMSPLRPSKEVC